jgi:hypothetical protein
MKLATVKEIATHLGLSEIRIRHVLGKDGAPAPVIPMRPGYRESIRAGKYDLKEVVDFYHATKHNKHTRGRW